MSAPYLGAVAPKCLSAGRLQIGSRYRVEHEYIDRHVHSLTVTVQNSDGTLWPVAMTFSGAAAPDRFNPAFHVNQEGYTVGLPKTALAGCYLGSLGELTISPRTFSLVSAATGNVVFNGTLIARTETGWAYTPPHTRKSSSRFLEL